MPSNTNKGKTPKSRSAARKSKRPSSASANMMSRKMLAPRAMLHACEKMFIMAHLDPFDARVRGQVCYPGYPAKRSVKFTAQANIPVVIGTGGIGYLWYDVTPANSVGAIFYTTAAYTGTSASPLSNTGTGVTSSFWTSPTASSIFTESVTGNQFRMVVAGARFRYTGTELNRGGSVHATVSGQQTGVFGRLISSCFDPNTSREMVVSPQYQTVLLPASSDGNYQWKDSDELYPWTDGGGVSGNGLQALVFVGTAGNTFNVRLISHYEVTGPDYNAFASESHIGDPRLIQSVTSAAASATYGVPAPGRSYSDQFLATFQSIADSPAVQAAVNFARAAVSSYAARSVMSRTGMRLEL